MDVDVRRREQCDGWIRGVGSDGMDGCEAEGRIGWIDVRLRDGWI